MALSKKNKRVSFRGENIYYSVVKKKHLPSNVQSPGVNSSMSMYIGTQLILLSIVADTQVLEG